MASFPPDRPATVGHEVALAESPPEGERRDSAASGIMFPASGANPSAKLLSEVAQLNANYARLRRIRTSNSAQHALGSYPHGASSPQGPRDSAHAPIPSRYGPSTIGRNLLDASDPPLSPLARATPAQEHATPPPPQPIPLAHEGPPGPHKQHGQQAPHGQAPQAHAGPVQGPNGQLGQSGHAQHAQGQNGHAQGQNGHPQHTQADYSNRQPYKEYQEYSQRPQDNFGSPAVSMSAESSPSPSGSSAPPSPSDVDRLMMLVREKQGQARSPGPADSVEHWKHKCHFEGCGKAFKQKAHLQTHLRSHTGERPFACPFPQCGKTFSQQCNLRAHVRAHTGERPFKCSVCGKGFSQQGNMRNHLLIHYNDHPIECRLDGCDRRFNQLGNLKAHQNTAHQKAVHALMDKLKNGTNLDNMEPEERDLFDHFCKLYKNANRGIRGRGKGTKSIVGRESPGGPFYSVSPQPSPSPTSPTHTETHDKKQVLETSPSLSGPSPASSEMASPMQPSVGMQQPTPVEPPPNHVPNTFAPAPPHVLQHTPSSVNLSQQQQPPPQLMQQPLHSAQPVDSLLHPGHDPAHPLTHTIQQHPQTMQQPLHYQPQMQQHIQLPTQSPAEDLPQNQPIQQPQQVFIHPPLSQSVQMQPYLGSWDGRQLVPSEQHAPSVPMMVPDCSPYQFGVAPSPSQGFNAQQYPFPNGAM